MRPYCPYCSTAALKVSHFSPELCPKSPTQQEVAEAVGTAMQRANHPTPDGRPEPTADEEWKWLEQNLNRVVKRKGGFMFFSQPSTHRKTLREFIRNAMADAEERHG